MGLLLMMRWCRTAACVVFHSPLQKELVGIIPPSFTVMLAQTQHSCHQPQTHLPCESDSENKASCWAFVRRLRRVYEGGGISGAMCSVSLPYPASSGGSMSRRVCMSNWKCP